VWDGTEPQSYSEEQMLEQMGEHAVEESDSPKNGERRKFGTEL
jgi:hypothetical protein